MRRTWTLTLGQRSAVTTKQHRLSENARPYAGTEVAGRPDLPATSPDAQGTIPERSPTGDCSFSIRAAANQLQLSGSEPARGRSYQAGFARNADGSVVASSRACVSWSGAPCRSSGALVNPRRPTLIVAGNTNGSRTTTTGNLVNPVLLLWMKSPPKTPTNSTASHMVMMERPAHNALA